MPKPSQGQKQKQKQKPTRESPAKNGAATSTTTATAVPKCIQSSTSGVRLVVCVKPNSRSNSVVSVDDEAVSLHIAAEAKDGKANAELVEYVAEVLAVHRRDVSVDKGSRSHDKLVLVSGIDATTAFSRLKCAIE